MLKFLSESTEGVTDQDEVQDDEEMADNNEKPKKMFTGEKSR